MPEMFKNILSSKEHKVVSSLWNGSKVKEKIRLKYIYIFLKGGIKRQSIIERAHRK